LGPERSTARLTLCGARQGEGACGCFRSRLYHASVAPASHSEHLKLAYFFRASTKGERRAKRSLAGGSVDDEDEELAHRRKSVATELSRCILGAEPKLMA